MIFVWPTGLCFLALQVCQNCTNNAISPRLSVCDATEDRSSLCDVPTENPVGPQGNVRSIPTGTVVSSYGECEKDVFPGLYVKLDSHLLLNYINNVTALADHQLTGTVEDTCSTRNAGKCIFPFKFNGETFLTCSQDSMCAVQLDSNGDVSEWDECTTECPQFEDEKPVCELADGSVVYLEGDQTCNNILSEPLTETVESQTYEGSIIPVTQSPTSDASIIPVTQSPTTQASIIPVTQSSTSDSSIIPVTQSPTSDASIIPVTQSAARDITITPVIETVNGLVNSDDETCLYTCRKKGSCTVRLNTRTVTKDGNLQGFCFGKIFGGHCSGTPAACSQCSEVCLGKEGEQFEIAAKKDPSDVAKPKSKSKPDFDSCDYTCHANGQCFVKLSTSLAITGSIKGSCYPPAFGGKCTGTPRFCDDCIDVCKSATQKEISIPVKEIGPNDEFVESDNSPLEAPIGIESCVYTCQKNGLCSVDFVSEKVVSGNIKGSCYPPKFGGKCNGIPKQCSPCTEPCKIQPGGRIFIPVGASEPTKIDEIDVSQNGPAKTTCIYKCDVSGSCTVRIHSSRGNYEGSTLGSCFSKLAGGSCDGTPNLCSECLSVCEGKSGQAISIDVV